MFLFFVQNNIRNTASQIVHHTKFDFALSYWFPLFILGASPCWRTYGTWTGVLGSTERNDTEIIEVASVKEKKKNTNCMTDIWCRFKHKLIRKLLRRWKNNRFLAGSFALLYCVTLDKWWWTRFSIWGSCTTPPTFVNLSGCCVQILLWLDSKR